MILPSRPTLNERATAADRIYRALRDEIVRLERLPGTPLRERDIAAERGVSRTPVREAVLRLADERLIEIFPQSGTFVAPIKAEDALDALFLRAAIEESAARIVAETRAEAAANALNAVQERHERAGAMSDSGDVFYLLDEEFHCTLLSEAGHPATWRALHSAKAHMDRVRRLLLPDPDHYEHVLGGHRLVVTAIRSGDGWAAAAAVREHLEPFRDMVERMAKRYPSYFGLI